MQDFKKAWLLVAVVLISVVTGYSIWRGWRSQRPKRADTAAKPMLVAERGHLGRVRSVAFSPDGRLLASGSEDRTIKLWDAATGTNLRTLYGHSPATFIDFGS